MLTNNAAVRSMFLNSFISLFLKSEKESGYKALAEKVVKAENDLHNFKNESGYYELVTNKDNVVTAYGEKFYNRARANLAKKVHLKMKNIKVLRLRLKKADGKVANIMSKEFDMSNLISTFRMYEAKEQYDEGLITFVELVSAIFSAANVNPLTC